MKYLKTFETYNIPSKPGTAKSNIMKDVANKFGYKFNKIRGGVKPLGSIN